MCKALPLHDGWLPEFDRQWYACVALTGEAMPRRLLGVQPAGWASPQLHPYAHDPVTEDPEHHAWTMLGSTAQGNIYSRLAAPRGFFSESLEPAQEVGSKADLTYMQLCILEDSPGIVYRVLAASPQQCKMLLDSIEASFPPCAV